MLSTCIQSKVSRASIHCNKFVFYFIFLLSLFCGRSFAQNTVYLQQLYNNSNFNNTTIDTGLAVGAVEGSHSVSATGAATYTIPIAVPPGTHGIAPSVQIVYNSQGGDGPLGIGWSIGGFSAIIRTGSDFYHEQAPTGVSFNSNDRFVLDGSRLVGVSGTYGGNGATYSTEATNFAVVTSFGNTYSSGPDSFRVVMKDGTIMEYGNTTDSKFVGGSNGVLVWRLNKMQDINGNYITYSYTQNNGQMVIDEIDYTGNANASLLPYNKVKFNYGLARSDNNTAYIAGYAINQNNLLTSIKITGDSNATFKTYNFNYGSDGVRSYLQEVIEQGALGGQLNKTIFKYGENQLVWMDNSTPTITPTSTWIYSTYDKNQAFAGDFNGDGKSDILISHQDVQGNTSGFTVYINGAAAYDSPPLTHETVMNSYNRVLDNFYATDFNGDKLDDIVTSNLVNGTNNALDHLTIYTSSYVNNIYSVTPHQIIAPPSTYNTIGSPNFLQFGDFDGDGRTDVLVTLFQANSSLWKSYVCFPFLSNYASIWIEVNTSNLPSTASPDQIHILDFDGDGKSDILFIQGQSATISSVEHTTYYWINGTTVGTNILYSGNYPTKTHAVYIGDFNGDGKADLFTIDSTNYYNAAVAYSTGAGLVNASNFSLNTPFWGHTLYCQNCTCQFSWECGSSLFPGCNHTNTWTGDEIYIGDFDGDGKSDILHYHPSIADCPSMTISSFFDVYYSTGNSFFRQNYPWNDSGLSSNDKFPERMIADMNGDGKADLTAAVMNQSTNLQTLYFDTYSNQSPDEKVIEKIKDGMGRVTQFSYSPLTWWNVHTQGPISNYPLNNVQFPLQVVQTLYEPNDNGFLNTINYTYTHAQFHGGGRGFLGFQAVDAYNVALNITNHSEYTIDLTYYTPWLSKTVKSSGYVPNTTTLDSIDNTVNFIAIGSNGIFTQQLGGTTENNYLTQAYNTTSNFYDTHGNITQSTANINNSTEIITTITNYHIGSALVANPDYSLPINSSTTTTWGSQASVTSKHTYSYNSANLLSTDVLTFGAATLVNTKTYIYDGFGNITNSTVTGYNNTSSTVSSTYDSKGRFPVSTNNGLVSTDPLYQSTSTIFDPLWGKPTSETDIAGNTTTHVYDEWGRITKTTPPFYSSITTSYKWNVNNNVVQWYTYTQHPGYSDLTIWYNQLGKEIQKRTIGFSGTLTSTKAYDNLGNLQNEIAPHLQNEPHMQTSYTYDYLNRLQTSTDFQGTTTYVYTYSNGNSTVETDQPGSTGHIFKTTDASGKIISTQDDGGILQFIYDSWGNTLTVTHGNSSSSIFLKTNDYDQYGRLWHSSDVNRGTTTYLYDDRNRKTRETDANNNIHNYTYDILDRMTSRTGPEGTTTYTYYGAGVYDKLHTVSDFNTSPHIETYLYNPDGSLQSETETNNGNTVNSESYQYDLYGRLSGKLGYLQQLDYLYDNYGNLSEVRDHNPPNIIYYQTGSVNGLGQPTQYTLGNGQTTTKTYSNGLPTQFTSTPNTHVQNLGMTWALAPIELMVKTDTIKHTSETFDYEASLDRLSTSVSSYNINTNLPVSNPLLQFIYDGTYGVYSRGNLEKSDAGGAGSGNFNYFLHGLTGVQNPLPNISPNLQNPSPQNIGYTGFNQPANITQGNYSMNFTYDADYQRESSSLLLNNALQEKREYHGDWERITDPGSNTDYVVNYIGGGDGICALSVIDLSGQNIGNITNVTDSSNRNSNTTTVSVSDGTNSCTLRPRIYYVYKDHLGSFLTLTDTSGNIAGEQNFDAWGRTRNPADWSYNTTNTNFVPMPSWMMRGFTGQEHLPRFGLINLNARMYDPVVGRMLGPDKYVGNAYSTQDYNAYSYVHNNPTKYTDPTGNYAISGLQNCTPNRNQNELWEFALAAGTGEIGAFVGDYVVMGLGGSVFVGGVASAAVSGFIGGAGNALVGGSSMGQALSVGCEMGGMGALSAGIGGVAMGGIGALGSGDDSWNGAKYNQLASVDVSDPKLVAEYQNNANEYLHDPGPEGFTGTNAEIQERLEETWGRNTLDLNHVDFPTAFTEKGIGLTKISDNYGKDYYGDFVDLRTGDVMDAYTIPTEEVGRSRIFVSPYVVNHYDDSHFEMVTGHELGHAYANMIYGAYIKSNSDYKIAPSVWTENIAYHFQVQVMMQRGMDLSTIQIYIFAAKANGYW